MSAQAKVVAPAKPRAQKRGIIRKKGHLLIIIINNITYFVTVKAVEDVVTDNKELTTVFGY